jgi:hypothetical protein
MTAKMTRSNPWLSAASAALLVYPLYFVLANLLKYNLGMPLLYDPMDAAGLTMPSPVLLLGSLLLAGVLNLAPLLRLEWAREGDEVALTARIRAHWMHLILAGLSGLTLLIILAYTFVENFGHI